MQPVVHKNTRGGFTLMEILVAMAIVGILASVGYSSYAISLQKSRDGRRKSELSQVQRALESFNNDYGVYPESCGSRIAGCGDGSGVCAWGGPFSTDVGKVYMSQLPVETKSNWNYVYLTSPDRRNYQLYARLENEQDPAYTLYSVECTIAGDECTYGLSSPNVILDAPLVPNPC